MLSRKAGNALDIILSFYFFAYFSDPIMKRIKGVRAACEQHGVETT